MASSSNPVDDFLANRLCHSVQASQLIGRRSIRQLTRDDGSREGRLGKIGDVSVNWTRGIEGKTGDGVEDVWLGAESYGRR